MQNAETDPDAKLVLSCERKTLNSELWHACAGPLVSLPQVGSLVFYFPQGHSEQIDNKGRGRVCVAPIKCWKGNQADATAARTRLRSRGEELAESI
ncbi:hypothetical protein JHK87_004359 [Glycine soja]|nr:hypothetical protein JHK87_004359 [Glycine soja]